MNKRKVFLFIIVLGGIGALIYFFFMSGGDDDGPPPEEKQIGGGKSDCEELSYQDWEFKKQWVFNWALDQPQNKRDEIYNLYANEGDSFESAAWRFAHDEMLRKGYCEHN